MLNYKKQILFPLLAASLVLTIAMGWLFLTAYHLLEIRNVKDEVDSARIDISNLRSTIVDAETGQRGYLLTGNVTFLEPYNQGLEKSSRLVTSLSLHARKLPELRPLLGNIQQLIDKKFRIIESSLQIQLNAGSYASHLSLSKDYGRVVMDQIRSELQSADDGLQAKARQIEAQISNSLWQAIVGSVILVLVICSILLLEYRRVVKLFDQVIHARKIADELGYQAVYDPLTEIPNRRGFDEHLKRVLAMSEREHEAFAVFYMDLDGFKAINDNYGHDAGDEALIEAIRRFIAVMREADFLARIGGDEFAAVIQKYHDQSELESLAERIIGSLASPISFVSGHQAVIGVSIGVACYPGNGGSSDALILAADEAMYAAKGLGKNRVCFA